MPMTLLYALPLMEQPADPVDGVFSFTGVRFGAPATGFPAAIHIFLAFGLRWFPADRGWEQRLRLRVIRKLDDGAGADDPSPGEKVVYESERPKLTIHKDASPRGTAALWVPLGFHAPAAGPYLIELSDRATPLAKIPFAVVDRREAQE